MSSYKAVGRGMFYELIQSCWPWYVLCARSLAFLSCREVSAHKNASSLNLGVAIAGLGLQCNATWKIIEIAKSGKISTKGSGIAHIAIDPKTHFGIGVQLFTDSGGVYGAFAPLVFPISLPHFRLYEVVSVIRRVIPYTYGKILEMLLTLMELCEKYRRAGQPVPWHRTASCNWCWAPSVSPVPTALATKCSNLPSTHWPAIKISRNLLKSSCQTCAQRWKQG